MYVMSSLYVEKVKTSLRVTNNFAQNETCIRAKPRFENYYEFGLAMRKVRFRSTLKIF